MRLRKNLSLILAISILFSLMPNLGVSFAEEALETVKIKIIPNLMDKRADKTIGIVKVDESGKEEEIEDGWIDYPLGTRLKIRPKNGEIGIFNNWTAKKPNKLNTVEFTKMFGVGPKEPELEFTITEEFKGGNITIEAKFDKYTSLDTSGTDPSQGCVEIKLGGKSKDVKSKNGHVMINGRDKLELKAVARPGYEFEKWEFSTEEFNNLLTNVPIDKSQEEIVVETFYFVEEHPTVRITAKFKRIEGYFEVSDYVKDIKLSQGYLRNFKLEDDKIIMFAASGENFDVFSGGEDSKGLHKTKLIITTENISNIKVDNPYRSQDGKVIGKTKEATSEEWSKGIELKDIGVTDDGFDKLGFYKESPLEFTFYTNEGEEIKLVWDVRMEASSFISRVNLTELIKGYKNEKGNLTLVMGTESYENFSNFLVPGLEKYKDEKLSINLVDTDRIASVLIDNSKFSKDGYKGLKTGEKTSDQVKEGIKLIEFGAEKDGNVLPAIDRDNPPKIIIKTIYGEELEMDLNIDKLDSKMIVGLDFSSLTYDPEAMIEVLDGEGKPLEINKEKKVTAELKEGDSYTIRAKEGILTKFKEWKISAYNPELENFNKIFSESVNHKEIKLEVTRELINLVESGKFPQFSLEANFNIYTSVEVMLKEELEKRTFALRSMPIYEYNNIEMNKKIEGLKAGYINYTHKIDSEMGTTYIILKGEDGKLIEKTSSSFDEDIILASSRLDAKERLELVGIPKEGYEFKKWQVITPAMDIKDDWDSKIHLLDPSFGIFAEVESPYIKTVLQGMALKPKDHRYRFRANAVFKKEAGQKEEIEAIEEISREYIKGYTDISDVLIKTAKVKYKTTGEVGVIPINWGDLDIEGLDPGKHVITGKLNNPNFKDEEVKLNLIVKEIVGVEDSLNKEVINSMWFTDSGISHNLPKKVKMKITDGRDTESLELDVSWSPEALNPEETHEVMESRIVIYKHGKIKATGHVKGYRDPIEYKLDVVLGTSIGYFVDKNFETGYKDEYIYDKFGEFRDYKEGDSVETLDLLPQRQGYKFAGWYRGGVKFSPLDLNSSEKIIFPYKFNENDLKYPRLSLYSKWIEIHIDRVEDIKLAINGKLPDEIYILSTDGETIAVKVKQWSADNVDFSEAGKYEAKATIEWKLEDLEVEVGVSVGDDLEIPKYTVRFDSKGGSSIGSIGVEEGSKLKRPTDPIRDGYRFIGWYEDENLTNEFDFENPISEDISLYAKWEKEETISLEITSVELVKNKEILSRGEIKANKINLKLAHDFNDDVLDGKHYLRVKGTTGSVLSQGGYDAPIEKWSNDEVINNLGIGEEGNLTLSKDRYSKVYIIEITKEKVISSNYRVSFISNGGSSVGSIEVEEGSKLKRPIDPIRDGYRFIGWYEDQGFSRSFDFERPISKDMTLYARWEKLEGPIDKLDAKITSFRLLGAEASIDHLNGRIYVNLPYRTNLRSLRPEIICSDGASIREADLGYRDFDHRVTYLVSGPGLNSKLYDVDVSMPREGIYEGIINRPADWYRENPNSKSDSKDWYKISQELKAERLKAELEKTPNEIKKEALNQVMAISGQSDNSKRNLSFKQFGNYMEVKLNQVEAKDISRNKIIIPSGVLKNLAELKFDYLKYDTGSLKLKVYPIMDGPDGLHLNIKPAPNEKYNNIQAVWSKVKGGGNLFEIESNSTKAGLSLEIKQDKKLPKEKLRLVKYNYMKRQFEDISPDKWSVVDGYIHVDQVSAGIYGVIYK